MSVLGPGLLEGQVVLVSGGGSGIGRALAAAAGRLGARVAVCGRREGPLEETRDLVEGAGGEALARPCDIRRDDQVEELVRAVLARWGRIE